MTAPPPQPPRGIPARLRGSTEGHNSAIATVQATRLYGRDEYRFRCYGCGSRAVYRLGPACPDPWSAARAALNAHRCPRAQQ